VHQRKRQRSRWRTTALVGVVALTVVGTLAIGGNARTPTASGTSAASTPAPVAAEVATLAQHELEGDQLTYPPGVEVPSPSDLIPELAGATVQAQDGSSLVFDTDPDNPEVQRDLADAELDSESTGVTVHVAEGDLAVAEATYWQCAWIDEYLNAAGAGDAARMSAAKTQLNTFPALNAITSYAPEFAAQHDTIVEPMLAGDLDKGQRWLDANCNAYTDR